MKKAKCIDCGTITHNGAPLCEPCFTSRWENHKGFIKPKHNPLHLPWSMPKFRSVVTVDCVTNKSLFINNIVNNGQLFFDQKHNNYCYVLNQALGVASGSAVPANCPMPTYPLDSLIVVDAIDNPHVFAIDSMVVNYQISIKNYKKP